MARTYKTIAEVKLAHPKYSDERAKQVFENSQLRAENRLARELKRANESKAKDEPVVVKNTEPHLSYENGLFIANVCDLTYKLYGCSAFAPNDKVPAEFVKHFNTLVSANKDSDFNSESVRYFQELLKRPNVNDNMYGWTK